MSKALVLSGGGPVGVAWEMGLLAGLTDSGLNAADADYVLGTSAGSIVGAQLAAGGDPAEAYEERVRSLEEHLAVVPPPAPPSPPPELPEDPTERLIATGAHALRADAAPEDAWVTSFEPLVGHIEVWPTQFACTAIDTASGVLRMWDASSGIALVHAVSSSCCVPGLFPPVTIEGSRYMDGGMRSSTNADLVEGYDRVLVVAITTASGSRTERLRRVLEVERAALEARGGSVEVILPDAASHEAIGPNLMDAAGARAISDAARRQGRLAGPSLADFWNR